MKDPISFFIRFCGTHFKPTMTTVICLCVGVGVGVKPVINPSDHIHTNTYYTTTTTITTNPSTSSVVTIHYDSNIHLPTVVPWKVACQPAILLKLFMSLSAVLLSADLHQGQIQRGEGRNLPLLT